MNDLESEIRSALRLQAEQLHPGADVADYAPSAPPSTARNWNRLALVGLVAAALIVGVAVVAQRDPGTRVRFGGEPPPATAYQYRTPTVHLDADSIEVIAGGRTWTPGAEVVVHSDPGLWEQYTTLELTWTEDGVEQRIDVYFTADATHWWANEIRTYNGEPEGDWVEPAATGEFFRSPLGSTFTGDLELANLQITGLRLVLFPPPAACGGAEPLALIANYPTIDAYQDGGFGATFSIFDTATCAPIPVAPFRFELVTTDPTVADVYEEEQIEDYPPELYRIGLIFGRVGVTEVRVTAYPESGGIPLSVIVPITVLPLITAPDTPTDTAVVIPVPEDLPADCGAPTGLVNCEPLPTTATAAGGADQPSLPTT